MWWVKRKDVVIKHVGLTAGTSTWSSIEATGHNGSQSKVPRFFMVELQTSTVCFVRGDKHQWLVKDDVSCFSTGRDGGHFSQASCWLSLSNRIHLFLSVSWTFLWPIRKKNPPSWNEVHILGINAWGWHEYTLQLLSTQISCSVWHSLLMIMYDLMCVTSSCLLIDDTGRFDLLDWITCN